MWIQCVTPKHIETIAREKSYYFDFRYGTQAMGGSDGVKHIRIGASRPAEKGRVTVRVLWDYGTLKNVWTNYTLVNENGDWKIDDIAPQGYTTGGAEPEILLRGSKSLKKELGEAYRRAETKYRQEHKK